MSSNNYEAFASAAIAQAAHEKRAQPWKDTVDTQRTAASEEWVDVAGDRTGDDQEEVDVRKQAFPMGAVDVRTSAFPMGGFSALTHVFP